MVQLRYPWMVPGALEALRAATSRIIITWKVRNLRNRQGRRCVAGSRSAPDPHWGLRVPLLRTLGAGASLSCMRQPHLIHGYDVGSHHNHGSRIDVGSQLPPWLISGPTTASDFRTHHIFANQSPLLGNITCKYYT